jgi:hypothetical protein
MYGDSCETLAVNFAIFEESLGGAGPPAESPASTIDAAGLD